MICGYREDLQSPSRYRGDEPQSSVECSENTDNRYESVLCYDEVYEKLLHDFNDECVTKNDRRMNASNIARS